jgi:UPF0148 protein
MDEDEVLKKVTRLLEKGCTMLATHHNCGAPLFRCNGEVVCPVCSFGKDEAPAEEKIRPSSSSVPREEAVKNEGVSLSQGSDIASVSKRLMLNDDELARAKGRLCEAMLIRLKVLTKDLEEEQDLGKLKRQLDCVEGILRVFHSCQGDFSWKS